MRFGADVVMHVMMTRNGVLIDRDFLKGQAGDMVPFMAPEIVTEDKTNEKYFSLASAHDMRIKGVLEIDEHKEETGFNYFRALKSFAEK